MIELMIAAPASGSGKTVVTMALLSLLKKRGLTPCAYKCGPDYIDPMFHRAVTKVPCHNLDLFLCGNDPDRLKALYCRYLAGADAAVTEGVMGFFDGLGGVTDLASAYAVSEALELPVLLVVSPKGSSLTLAAVIRGLTEFRNSRISGILLNRCSQSLFHTLSPMLEKETGLPVLGFLPSLAAAEIKSRHLGLLTADEITDLSERIEVLSAELEETLDWERFRKVFDQRGKKHTIAAAREEQHGAIPIAVAKDQAFCFCYEETLDTLRDYGAEVVFFSPLKDSSLPKGSAALWLPGGYPELYLRELSENKKMLNSIREAITSGMPFVAECGGFLYLQREVSDETGNLFPMAGVFQGCGEKKDRLVRFGYTELLEEKKSLLFRPRERIPAHEFHYFDTDQNGEALLSRKTISGSTYRCGFTSDTSYAAFPHLYPAGKPILAERFVEAAKAYMGKKRNGGDPVC